VPVINNFLIVTIRLALAFLAQSLNQEIAKNVLNIQRVIVILFVQQHAKSFDVEVTSLNVIESKEKSQHKSVEGLKAGFMFRKLLAKFNQGHLLNVTLEFSYFRILI
jgi:hypothetical protein